MLSKADAQILTEQAQQHARELARLLVQLHDQEAWRVLGYPSFAAYIKTNFEESLRTIYRYIRQGRAQEALIGRDTLTRFTNGALEVLADSTNEQIQAIADIAARTTDGRIGADIVRSVQAAIAETLITGAVEGADGTQYAVSDVMVAGVQDYQRESVLSKREYIVGGEPARIEHFTATTITITVDVYTQDIYSKLTDQNPVRISMWREL